MKIKGLLLGMFACAALAACTNDDIVENNGKGEQEKVKANLTLVIGAATNSSRAADADNETGDATDPGTGVESGVTDAVVLLHKEGKEFAFFLTSEQLNQQGSGTSITYEPQLTVAESGNYGVIVILNPCQEIKTAINAFINNSALPTGKNNMYDYITSYEVKATTGDNPTSAIATDNNFMMVNKVAVTADVFSNQAGSPSTASVDVERVVSKITYMPTQTNNLYEMEDVTAKYTVTTTSGWRVEDNIATYMTGMACGTLNEKNIYEHKGVYYEENGTYSGSTEHQGEALYKKMTGVDQEQIKWKTTQTTGSRNWYVKLDKVALVNLSNSVYAVRHLATENNWTPSFFGTLSSSNYLMDPNTVTKNNGGTEYADYFYNVASAVKQVQVTNMSDQETDDFKSYFKDLPTVADENNVGTTLAYCFENIVKKANQNGNYVTGVIFRGQICNADGSSYSNNVYKYKGKYYLSLAEAAANNDKSVTEVEADTENLTTYESGHCYYCSKDIFHHEGSETMERVIMRNNAYVLKVTGFKTIGSAEIVFPTGDEQGEDTDKNFYLKLTSTILPWQVRFNNIEF